MRCLLLLCGIVSPVAAQQPRVPVNVYACGRRGDWLVIVFDHPGQRTDCEVMRLCGATMPYPGPCRSGWVYHRYIVDYADWISP